MIGKPRMGREHKQFRWAVGIESSCIPHLGIDQFQWTQHDKFWKDDFKRAAHELGCKWMRYSLPWHLVEPSRNQFDWSDGAMSGWLMPRSSASISSSI